jgi:thioredoxin reductase (NADPH)
MEALRYYRRVADTYDLDVATGQEVTSLFREDETAGPAPFAVESRSSRGVRRVHHAKAVVVATGCFDKPNLLGVPGEDLPHVSHYYTDPHPYYRRSVVIVGGKNSAAEAALDLYRAGAQVSLVHRGEGLGEAIKYWVKPDIENRIKEGAIPARFKTRVVEIRPTSVEVERDGVKESLPADAVFLLTGYRSDNGLLERAGVDVDPVTCAPAHDPETLETNVPGLFLAGAVVSGMQSGKIFIENGRFHGEQVIKTIQRRLTSND